MEAPTKTEAKSLVSEIAQKLTQAQQEIDELVVQMALGKAEAKDKFEELKNDFKKRLSDLKVAFLAVRTQTQLKEKIEELERLLQSGKAEDKTIFDIQKEKILNQLSSIENEVLKKVSEMPHVQDFLHEAEIFKLKMEILRLKFGLKKFEIKDSFRTWMKKANDTIENISSRVKTKIKTGKATYTDFRNEVQQVYQHMKKALEVLSQSL